jgi:hypothetical protein
MPNLLVNGGFKVNQRGQASYAGGPAAPYSLDGWRLYSPVDGGAQADAAAGGGVTLAKAAGSHAYLLQYTEGFVNGSFCALSAMVDGTVRRASGTVDGTRSISTGPLGGVAVDFAGGADPVFRVIAYDGAPHAVSWAKLEHGAGSPCVPEDPATELMRCQRMLFRLAPYTRAAGIRFLADTADFPFAVPVPLRISPSVTGSAVVYSQTASSSSSGFTLSVAAWQGNFVALRAYKAGHGFTDGWMETPGGILLDAGK